MPLVAPFVVALAGAAGALVALAAMVLRGPRLDWDAARLAHTAAFLTDGRFYAAPDTGVVLGTYYGPVATAFYVPAALISDPAWGVVIASVMSVVAFVGPLLLWMRPRLIGLVAGSPPSAATVIGADVSVSARLAIGAAFVMGAVATPSLAASVTQVHADAPALALAVIACILVAADGDRSRRGRTLAIAGVIAALAVGAKQTMLPVLVAVPVWLAVREGARRTAVFVAGAGITLALGVAIVAARGELAAAWFHAVQLNLLFPSATSTSPALAVAMSLAQAWAPVLIIGARWWVGRDDARSRSAGTDGAFSSALPAAIQLLLLVALTELPAAVAGQMKYGGSENALSPFLIFVWHAGVVALLSWPATRTREQSVLAFATLVVAGTFAARPGWAAAANDQPVGETISAVAAAHERAHPGETWFVMNPLPSTKLGGRATHFLPALYERSIAGRPVSDAQFRAHLPPRMRRACVPSAAGMPEGALGWMRLRLAAVSEGPAGERTGVAETPEPSLSGWLCYAIAEPPRREL